MRKRHRQADKNICSETKTRTKDRGYKNRNKPTGIMVHNVRISFRQKGEKNMLGRDKKKVRRKSLARVNFIVFMIATKCKKSKNQINYSNVPQDININPKQHKDRIYYQIIPSLTNRLPQGSHSEHLIRERRERERKTRKPQGSLRLLTPSLCL